MTAPRDDARNDEAARRARHGQSLAMGDTGTRDDAGVDPERQGISNRPGDRAEDAPLADRDTEGVEPDAGPGDRTTTKR